MSDPSRAVWDRADRPDPVFSADELAGWPAGVTWYPSRPGMTKLFAIWPVPPNVRSMNCCLSMA